MNPTNNPFFVPAPETLNIQLATGSYVVSQIGMGLIIFKVGAIAQNVNPIEYNNVKKYLVDEGFIVESGKLTQ